MKVLNLACSWCLFHGVSVAAQSQHEVEVDDEGQLMEVQLLQVSRKVGKKSLETSAAGLEEDSAAGLEEDSAALLAQNSTQTSCEVGDHVPCPGGHPRCAGNQCCPDGSTCPSASPDFHSCSRGKTNDCTSGSPAPGPDPAPRPGPRPAPRPAPVPVPVPAPVPAPVPIRSPATGDDCGSDAACIVAQLNARYMAFDENDPNSPLGVTLRMATHDDFSINCGNGCYNGYSDCKMSASLYNHRVMRTRGGQVVVAMNRNAGMIFHHDAVENRIAKCAFQYDGGTYWNVNRGCGCSGSHDCNDPNGAFRSTVTAGDDRVHRCSCMGYQERHGGQLPGRHGQLCHWPGAAYDNNAINPANNRLFDMLTQRLSSQNAQGDEESLRSWTEVVLDGVRMQEDLRNNPNSVVQAFFFVSGRSGQGFANRMADKFQREFGARLPVIQLDPNGGPSGHPFRV